MYITHGRRRTATFTVNGEREGASRRRTTQNFLYFSLFFHSLSLFLHYLLSVEVIGLSLFIFRAVDIVSSFIVTSSFSSSLRSVRGSSLRSFHASISSFRYSFRV